MTERNVMNRNETGCTQDDDGGQYFLVWYRYDVPVRVLARDAEEAEKIADEEADDMGLEWDDAEYCGVTTVCDEDGDPVDGPMPPAGLTLANWNTLLYGYYIRCWMEDPDGQMPPTFEEFVRDCLPNRELMADVLARYDLR